MRKIKLRILKLLLSTLVFCSLSDGIFAQGFLSGTISDTSGEKLVGVSVFVKSSNEGTTSDFGGNYSISLASGEQTIVFSYIGYSSYETTITVEGESNYTQDIVLRPDSFTLDAVVVTGTFSGRTQKESPMSITTIGSAKLQTLTANSQADILRTIPGITAEGGGGEVASNVFVRGMPSGGQYQFTPLQVDGLPVLSTFGLNSSAHDVYFRNDIGIKNLEFVRGGSSTLFGAGSVAGIINYTSITGTPNQQNKMQLEWADGGRIKTDILSAGPLAKDLFYAVSGFYRYDEGPLDTGLITRGHQVRGNIKKIFNDGNSSLTISGQHIDDNVQFYLPYPLTNNSDSPERPDGNDGETVYTTLTSQATDYSFDTPFGRFQSPIGDGVSTKGHYFMLNLKHTFGDNWKLSTKIKTSKYDHWFNLFLDGDGTHNVPETQSSYLTDRELPSDAQFTYTDDGTKLASSDLLFQNRLLDRRRPMEELVGEAYLTKKIGVHNISFGTFLSNTKARDDNWITHFVGDFRNAPRVVDITYTDGTGNTVNYATDGFISGSQTSNRHFESSKIAFFAGDEIKTEKFNLDFGIRWERASGIISKEATVGSNEFEKGTVSASDFAIALAGMYKLSEATNLYANFSKGYFFPQLRSVKFSTPGNPATYELESVLQAEAGVKYSQKNLAITGALFYVTLDDRRDVTFVNSGSSIIENVEIQSTRSVGIEASLNYTLTKGLDLYGNFTYQAHEFTKVEGKPEQEGNKQARQPNILGLAGLSYNNDKIDANFSGNFSGKKYANAANTVELDPFSIFRLDAGYKFPLGEKESMRLGFSVFNLFDSAGVTEGSPRQGDAQSSTNEYFVGRPILPRRIFVRLTFNF